MDREISLESGQDSYLVSRISSRVTDVAGAISNAWNSLPPSEKQAVVVGITIAAVAVTGGLAAPAIAPIAFGAAFSAGANLGLGLATGTANVQRVVTAATIGGLSGGASGAVGSIYGQALIGSGTTFVDQLVNSIEATGHPETITADSLLGDFMGGMIGVAGGEIGAYWDSSSTANVAKATLVSTLAGNVAGLTFPPSLGPLVTGPSVTTYYLSYLQSQ